MKSRVTDYLLYRWRFQIGFLAIVALIGLVVWVVALNIPGELRNEEVQSAITSGELARSSLEPSMVVNLPYHILQRASIKLLGVTAFSIKLPSLILGTLTLLGVFMLMRAWLKYNVAVITTLALATTTQFLFMAQDGTPAIIFNAVAIWLLVAGMYVTRGKYFRTFWKVLGGVLMAMALYIPLGVYLVLTLVTTAIIHPHIRFIVKRLGRTKIILASIFGLVSLAPLVYAIIIQPSIALELTGIPSGLDGAKQAALTTLLNLFGFVANSDGLLRPAYSLTLTLVALIGLYNLMTTRYTARSYIAVLLSLVLVPLAFLVPAHSHVIYLLMVITVASGFDFLIRYWYRLFPRNPYARVAGLLPLAVLVSGLTFTDIMHYADGYRYTPSVLSHYSQDLDLVRTQAAARGKLMIATTKDERPLYELSTRYTSQLELWTDEPSSEFAAITRSARSKTKIPKSWRLEQIVTNDRTDQGDRLYIYKINR